MKKLIALTTLALSISVNAMTYVDSPNIAFGLRYIDVTKTCIQGDYLRTQKKVPLYEQYHVGNDTRFRTIGRDYLYKPLTYKKEICIYERSEVCTFEYVTETIKTDYVFDIVQTFSDSERVVGQKEFTIPFCK